MKTNSFRTAGYVILAALGILAVAGCATYSGNLPVDTGIDKAIYISPAVADGVQDRLVVPIVVGELPPGVRIKGYSMTISDTTGGEVFSTGEELPDVEKRKLRQAPPLEVPNTVEWDGRNSNGFFVPDGEYRYSLEAWDYFGNRGTAGPEKVIVDNKPPAANVSYSAPVFSPNGDGRFDTLAILHVTASSEDQWIGRILDSGGASVAEYRWEGVPEDIVWDGRDVTGNPLPDGGYRYSLASTDRAGNSFFLVLDPILLDTAPAEVHLTVRPSVFSPNGDGILDTLNFIIEPKIPERIRRWTLSVHTSSGEEVFETRGTGAPPASLLYDGSNSSGGVLSDGSYQGVIEVEHKNGDVRRSASPSFILDTTPPSATVQAEYLLFSPDGDGRKDLITVYQSTSEEQAWLSEILDSRNSVVRRHTWRGKAYTFSWDGKTQSGTVVPDGTYVYRLTSRDEGGNSAEIKIPGIRVDNRVTPVRIAALSAGFSPNGDGILDTLQFALSADIREEIEVWTVRVLDADGTEVRVFTHQGDEPVAEHIIWDGKDTEGIIREGRFRGELRIQYAKGNEAVAVTEPVLLDITPPKVSWKAEPLPFSPDGDGTNDIVRFEMTTEDASPISGWRIEIRDPMGKEFRSFSGTGNPSRTITWNGISETGELVEAAYDYPVAVTVRDALWNTARLEELLPIDVLVFRDGDRLKIRISAINFAPFTADYLSLDSDKVERNLKTLDRLAEILEKYGTYRIRLEGHAVRLLWNDPAGWPAEERDVLKPLSEARAQAIKTALTERGIRAERMTTYGYGGTVPFVPHGDTENRWKSRRVEFILIRN